MNIFFFANFYTFVNKNLQISNLKIRLMESGSGNGHNYGGTFGKASTRSGYTAGILGDGTVIIKGGTFGFDPTKWVADGYEAVKTGDVWVVSAK